MLNKIEQLFHNNQNLLALIGRVFIGLAMASHGYGKLMGMQNFSGYMVKLGVPFADATAVLVMLIELLGGILIAVGWKTRLNSFLVMGVMLVAGLWVHAGDPFAKQEKSLLFAAACLLLMAYGPGKFSVDKR
jgi:putative oxidoreductase